MRGIKGAKETFDKMVKDSDMVLMMDDIETIKLALEKQTSKEVEFGTEGGYDWYCGCGHYLGASKDRNIRFCSTCGQKLKWD